MEFRNLPIYQIVVNLDDEETGMSAISLVDDPAIERSFELFGKQEPLKLAIQNDEKRLVTGPAIIAGLPIYRRSMELGEYYVVFTEDTIDTIIEKYSKQGLWNSASLQHDGVALDNVVAVEFYKKDSKRGIVPTGYEDVADGSLFVTFKIEDEELWNTIKTSGEFSGFSIEVMADLEPTNETVEEEDCEMDDELEALLRELLGDDVEFDWLWSSQKKKFATDWSVIENAVENNAEIKVKYGDKTITGTPYAVYERRGSSNVAIYSDKTGWHVLNEKNITNITTTGRVNNVDWIKAVGDPSFDWVSKSMDEAVGDIDKSPEMPKSDYERAIIEHKVAMITYLDEVGKETGVCVSNRQCGVFEYGYTQKGNAALRIYEYFGSTHHPEDMPGWRTLRLDRIRSFRLVEWMEPLTVAPAGFREIGMGEDRDGFVCLLRSDLKVG